MNSYERVMNAVKFMEVDVVPACPFVLTFAAKHNGTPFSEYCTDYRKLAKAQLDCVEDFGYDIVTADSDAYREAHACGAVLEFPEDDLPIEKKSAISDKKSLINLSVPDPYGAQRMADKISAVSELKRQVKGKIPVQGWIEAPFQSASILRGLNNFMLDMYDDVDFIKELIEFACEMGIKFGKAQIEAGADIIGIGDAVATLVSEDMYREFALPYTRKLIGELKKSGGIVKYHICGDSGHLYSSIMEIGTDILNIDSKVDLRFAKELSKSKKVCIKGNLDPMVIMKGSKEEIEDKVKECIEIGGTGYILSAGCEIPKDTPSENFRTFINARYR